MNNIQKNKRTMYGNVVAFLQGPGHFFLSIGLIAELSNSLRDNLTAIDAEAAKQGPPTAAVSQAREQQKNLAAEAAEALRQYVLVLSTNAVLRGELKLPVSGYREGDETLFIDYLNAIATGLATLPADQLQHAGYTPALLEPLTANLALLAESDHTVPDLIKSSKMATDNLLTLFASTDELLTERLDRLVHAQVTQHRDLVDGYDDARAAVHAAGTRQPPRFKGSTPYNAPQLVFDRTTVHILKPTLGNRSGKGIDLLYYTGYQPTDQPTPGKGVTVRNRERLEQANYDALGPADAPLLLVKQLTLTQDGEYYVLG